ncbi:MAG TPA: serine/threonine-protein kinase, partial [Polyangiaceae bacterium]|nr:serine/threonine-protein kinase [Polyangiaceae bacterium]
MSNPTETSRQRDPVPTDSRYECLLKIASGGMATVYVGRLRGRYGFSRLVAIKRAHAHLLDDEQFRRLLIGEARLASRIHHPNVVSVLDVDEPREELLLVMDYVEGAALSQLLSACREASPLPVGVTVRIMIDVCAGLHAAHELRGERGEPLEIVHRDVSPQNVLVGVDGLSRITDFGVAKWTEATQATTNGWKGKFAYMAPEYVRDRVADRRADVFGVGVMLWEALANRRLFRGEDGGATMWLVANHTPEEIGALVPGLPPELAQVVARALEKEPDARYATAKDLADALE